MKLLLVLVVALAGCAVQVKPDPRTVRVEVPVVVPCRAPAVEAPSWATASLQKGDSLQTKVRALLAELEQRKGYEVQLVAAVQACQ
jgi:phosphatidylserine decarboxylase